MAFVDVVNPAIVEVIPKVEAIYKELHMAPELSMQEFNTAAKVAAYLRNIGVEVTEKVGVTGVVAQIKNGEGPVIMLRADMDGLPMKEDTGVDYACTATTVDKSGKTVPLAHACGHDMHITWLLGALTVMNASKNAWKGTVIGIFQPGEEIAAGSKAMLSDGLMDRFPKPDIILGQHLVQGMAGTCSYRAGQILTAGDSMKVTFYGKGGHGGMPNNAIDPIIMAASAVMRLQAVVAREVPPQTQAVITVGEFHAGTAENIIPDEAYIKLNIRTTDEEVREHVLAAVKRVCDAEAAASNAPKMPSYEPINDFPLTVNDKEATMKIAEAFAEHFGQENVTECPPAGASEDFSRYGRAWNVPYVYWFVGGTAPEKYAKAVAEGTVATLPGPHSPFWAPVLHPTIEHGIKTMLIAAGLWLIKK